MISKSSKLTEWFLLSVVLLVDVDDEVDECDDLIEPSRCWCCRCITDILDEFVDLFVQMLFLEALEEELLKWLDFALAAISDEDLLLPATPTEDDDDAFVESADNLRETNEMELAGDMDPEVLLLDRPLSFSGDDERCRLKLGPSSWMLCLILQKKRPSHIQSNFSFSWLI